MAFLTRFLPSRYSEAGHIGPATIEKNYILRMAEK
jgi:hypothetical protein